MAADQDDPWGFLAKRPGRAQSEANEDASEGHMAAAGMSDAAGDTTDSKSGNPEADTGEHSPDTATDPAANEQSGSANQPISADQPNPEPAAEAPEHLDVAALQPNNPAHPVASATQADAGRLPPDQAATPQRGSRLEAAAGKRRPPIKALTDIPASKRKKPEIDLNAGVSKTSKAQDRPADAATETPAIALTPIAGPTPRSARNTGESGPTTDKSPRGSQREGIKKRAHGEFRSSMQSVSLKRRAFPVALSLALVSIAGFLTEVVAAAAVISMAGPESMLVVYPLGGIGLLLLALAQFRFIDGRARLPMIRRVALIYTSVFVVAIALMSASVVPVIAVGAMWLMADQLNFLLPLMIWSMAGDEFNVAEGRKIFGWIVSWTYLGQVAGLAIATLAAPVLANSGVPLTALLGLAPIVTLFVALWLPRTMRGSAAATGLARQEDLATSLRSAWHFVAGVPVWRHFLAASIITFAAGMLVFITFLTGVDDIADIDQEELQMLFGGVSLASFLVCWLIQIFVAQRLEDRIGIPGVLLILPIFTAIASGLLLAGVGASSVVLLSLGAAFWLIPRWSVDENARRAALALVPDERRTRVSFFVDLGPVALGLIMASPLAAIGLLLGQVWLVPVVALVLSLIAIYPGVLVLRGWEDSLLSWRLRRRKRSRTIELGDD